MKARIDPGEAASIQDLLSDFSKKPGISVEDVSNISWTRFNTLSGLLSDLNLPEETYEQIPRLVHKFIFNDLFTFAGKYRNKSDPKGGRIHFGLQKAHSHKAEFTGSSPNKIDAEVKEAIKYLTKDAADPVFNAAVFYQKFVKTHPFYDANGRIGRLITTIYLKSHGLELSWHDFKDKKSFLSKLNRCHVNPTEETYSFLAGYLRKFIHEISSFDISDSE